VPRTVRPGPTGRSPPASTVGVYGGDPDPGRASEIEVRFTAGGPGRTTVEPEHRPLDRLVGGQAIRDAIQMGGGGWTAILELFAKAAADPE
jgi:hypothetical protein